LKGNEGDGLSEAEVDELGVSDGETEIDLDSDLDSE
jgi:hypothetical protein